MHTRSDMILVLLAPATLLLGALLQILLAGVRSARTKGILALLCCLPSLGVVARLVPLVRGGRAIDGVLATWDGPLTLAFHVDALSILFALMGTGLGAIVLLYSIAYMEHDRSATRFYTTMLAFIGGFVALVFSADLFLLYLCWEVIGLCSFSLVGFWYSDREASKGARKVLLMTHIAGYGLLAAILILYHRTGCTLWTDPRIAHSFTSGVFLLMLVALVAKSVQVPLHTWIPDAMAAPTPVSSLLHAACYVTAGVYLAARMHSFGLWPALWSAALMWIGTVTMIVGVMYAMVQSDLKRMLAFSTISQIGYMMVGLGIGTSLAITAGLLHCLNHGFFKGGLFLNAGAVQHAAGTRDMNQLGGLAPRMPRTTLAWLIGVGNMAGIPLMSGFVSKWMLYTAALQAGWVVPALAAWVVSLGTVFLCAKATSAVFLGEPTEKTRHAHEAPAAMQWAMGLMAAGSVILGIAPQLAVNYLLMPILSAFSLNTDLQVTWFGLFSGAGSFSTLGGLVLALVSLVLGGAIYALAHVTHPVATGGAALAGASGGIFTGGETLTEEGRLTAGDFSRIFEQSWRPFFHWSNADPVYLSAWRGLHAAAEGFAVPVRWMEERAAVWVAGLVPVAVLGAAWFIAGFHGVTARASPAESHSVPVLLPAACTVAATALLLAAWSQIAWRKFLPWMFLVGATAIGGLSVRGAEARFGLLELAALLTIPLVVACARTRSARLAYAVAIVTSVFLLAAGHWLPGRDAAWCGALLIIGACLKLAAVPFLFWLLRVADELPALVLGLIIAVVDIAAYGELYATGVASPASLGPPVLWLAIAAATSLVAALLMLAQRDLKRLLVLSTVEDVGFLFLGLASARTLGTSGALVAAATHALAKALLFASLSGPEAGGALESGTAGLAFRYPVSGFGFVFGMLAMLGVPPTLGYIGRWRLYETAVQISPALLAMFLVASALALIAYVLALTRVWWGPAASADADASASTPSRVEPALLRATILALVVLLVVPGLWPSALQIISGGQP